MGNRADCPSLVMRVERCGYENCSSHHFMASLRGMLYFFLNRPRRVLVSEPIPGKGMLLKNSAGRGLGGALRRAFPWLVLSMSLAGLLVWRPLREFLGPHAKPVAYSQGHQRLPESSRVGPAVLGSCPSVSHIQREGPATATFGDVTAAIRPTEGLLSGISLYAPFPTPPKRRAAVKIATMAQDLRGRRGALTRSDLGVLAHLELAAGRSQEAARLLKRALREFPTDAGILSDIAAIELDEGSRSGRAQRFLEAFDLTSRAVSSDPSSAEARFNRALALEHLFLPSAATLEWQCYLALDQSSQWAAEAWRHLQELQTAEVAEKAKTVGVEAGISDDPQRAREKIEDNLLPRWAEAAERGDDDEARRALTEATALASALVQTGNDPLAQDIVKLIVQTERVGKGGPRWQSLIRGHLFLGRGRSDLVAHRIEKASAELEKALGALSRSASPAVLLARLHSATALYQRNLDVRALDELSDLATEPLLSSYPSLLARVEWMLGLTELRLNRPGMAISAYERSLRLVHAQREVTNSAALEGLLAEALDLVGRPIEAWDHRYHALAWSTGQPPSVRVYNVLDDTVLSLVSQGHSDLALLFQDRLLAVSSALGNSEEIAMSLLRRARILRQLDRDGEAKLDLEKAISQLTMVDDSPTRQRMIAEVDLVRSEIIGRTDPQAAIRSLSRALAFRSQPELLRARSELYARTGDLSAAEQDLVTAIEAIERQRTTFGSVRDRIPLLDHAAGMFSSLLSLQLKSGKSEEAFLTAEWARARTLLDRLSAEPQDKAQASSLNLFALLPQNTTIVEYAVVDGRLVTWGADRSGLRPALEGPLFEYVENLVGGLQEARRQNDKYRVLNHLHWLYEVLISPWRATIRNDEALIFVPVGVLHEVPFAALFDNRVGRFLVQDHPSTVTPSVTVYVKALEDARARGHVPIRQALVVGNPSLADDSVALPPLPGAAEEATAIASLYPKSELLMHMTATRRRVLAAIAESDIVHLALHAKGSEDALGSRLLLTPEGNDRGKLTASEIFEISLCRPRLVVLAGCATAEGWLSESEGALSLAYAFQAAGVPSVVASLWDVNDRESAQILVRFHQFIRQNDSPMEALRQAQLEYLAAHPDKRLNWAAFELIGAGTRTTSPM